MTAAAPSTSSTLVSTMPSINYSTILASASLPKRRHPVVPPTHSENAYLHTPGPISTPNCRLFAVDQSSERSLTRPVNSSGPLGRSCR
jgi:hypothetical protein